MLKVADKYFVANGFAYHVTSAQRQEKSQHWDSGFFFCELWALEFTETAQDSWSFWTKNPRNINIALELRKPLIFAVQSSVAAPLHRTPSLPTSDWLPAMGNWIKDLGKVKRNNFLLPYFLGVGDRETNSCYVKGIVFRLFLKSFWRIMK